MSDRKPYYAIERFALYDGETNSVHWNSNADIPRVTSGSREAAILVELDVDGDIDLIHADLCQTGDKRAITRAIVGLQRTLTALEDMYPEGWAPVGRCMGQGDWGRCYDRDGHKGAHKFPTS